MEKKINLLEDTDDDINWLQFLMREMYYLGFSNY